MKKRKTVLVVCLALFSLFVFSCRQKPVNTGPKTGKSFLWQLDTAAGKSYLLGSIHALKKEMYPLAPNIEAAFDNTDVLVVEADLSGDKLLEVGALLMKKGAYIGKETLKDNISEKTYNLTKEELKKFGMDIAQFRKSKPWFLAMTILSLEIMKAGFNTNYGIDKYFLDRAAAQKKEILELEGAGFQIELLDSFSPRESDYFLFATLQDTANFKEELESMVAAWSKGDVALMNKLTNKNIEQYPELAGIYKRLMDDRNEKMIEKLLTFFSAKKTYLIVVGAAHMVGKKGLVRLLKKKGFKLKQI
ncbi:MAG: TraB/GumN family protein [Candidatus Aminicenantes bacterium]|nr:TraB/GumN family protein [Candidatus Aminicenantes bacterium]